MDTIEMPDERSGTVRPKQSREDGVRIATVLVCAVMVFSSCYRQWFLQPTAPTPVYESLQFKRGKGEPVPSGNRLDVLSVGDCVPVIGERDEKDPSAFKVRLESGQTGWVFYGDGRWERAASCNARQPNPPLQPTRAAMPNEQPEPSSSGPRG